MLLKTGVAHIWETERKWYHLNSDIQTAFCAVPQGSLLGPLLFLSRLYKLREFKHKDLNILESEINSKLANVHICISANKLSLNIDKSNFVIFHPVQKRIP